MGWRMSSGNKRTPFCYVDKLAGRRCSLAWSPTSAVVVGAEWQQESLLGGCLCGRCSAAPPDPHTHRSTQPRPSVLKHRRSSISQTSHELIKSWTHTAAFLKPSLVFTLCIKQMTWCFRYFSGNERLLSRCCRNVWKLSQSLYTHVRQTKDVQHHNNRSS